MNKKSVYYSLVAFSLIAALIIGSLLAVTVIANSTADNLALYGYKLGTNYTVVIIMLAVCITLFAACTFVMKDSFKKTTDESSASACYGKLLTALALVAYIVYSIVSNVKGSGGDYSVANGEFSKWNILLMVLALASAAYFFASALFSAKIKKDVLGVVSLVPVIALVVKLILDYLIQNVGIHGDLYHYHLLSLCALVLFTVNESRFVIEKGIPALYAFFGMTGAVFTVVYMLPTVALVVKGYRSWDINAVYCLVDLAFVVYIYVRLFNVEWRNKQEKAPAVGIVAFPVDEEIDINSAEEEKNS